MFRSGEKGVDSKKHEVSRPPGPGRGGGTRTQDSQDRRIKLGASPVRPTAGTLA